MKMNQIRVNMHVLFDKEEPMIHTDNTNPAHTLGNIYHMTNAAAARVYELRRGFTPKVAPGKSHSTTALKEIQEGKIGLSVLLDVPKKKPRQINY